MRTLAVVIVGASAMLGIAIGAQAAQLKFTNGTGTSSCGNAGLTIPPSAPVSGEIDSDTAGTAVDPPPLSGCDAAQIKAAGTKAKCLLGLKSGALKKGVAPDPLKVQKCKDKLSSSFAKAELKPPCSTPGLAGVIELKVDAFVDDVVRELSPNLV